MNRKEKEKRLSESRANLVRSIKGSLNASSAKKPKPTVKRKKKPKTEKLSILDFTPSKGHTVKLTFYISSRAWATDIKVGPHKGRTSHVWLDNGVSAERFFKKLVAMAHSGEP